MVDNRPAGQQVLCFVNSTASVTNRLATCNRTRNARAGCGVLIWFIFHYTDQEKSAGTVSVYCGLSYPFPVFALHFAAAAAATAARFNRTVPLTV